MSPEEGESGGAIVEWEDEGGRENGVRIPLQHATETPVADAPGSPDRGPDMALDVTQIDHVSVIITDVARSRHFYRDILGLKEIAKPRTFDFVALWFDLGNQQLHLLRKPQADTVSPRHFALRVRDVKQAREHFRRLGVAIAETTVIPGCDRFFISDPDANRIEVVQWLEPYDPAKSGASALDQA